MRFAYPFFLASFFLGSTLAPAQVLDLAQSKVTLAESSALIKNWELKKFQNSLDPSAPHIDLKQVNLQEQGVQMAFDLQDFTYLNEVKGKISQTDQASVWEFEDQNIRFVRKVTPDASGLFLNVSVTADFKTKKPSFFFTLLRSRSPEKDPEERDRQLAFFSNGKIQRKPLKDDLELQEHSGNIKWIAALSRHFLIAVLPNGSIEPKVLTQPLGGAGSRTGQIGLIYPVTGNRFETSFRVFFGAKELDTLRAVDPSLDTAVDFGWFTIVAYPILKLIKIIYKVVANYGVAIILVTLMIKLLTFPLNAKSMKSMRAMAKLQPRIQELRERYKDDREALNREMLVLMRGHGYNPMAGCLPILIQMPVFFALYQVLYGSVELFHAPFMLWIHDLSAKDPYFVTPVLLTIAMFAQQKLTPTSASVDPAQQKIMQFMPIIFGIFMVTLPSGLTLYMLVNALASIAQQFYLNRHLAPGEAVVAKR